jgi:hypothetical protein
MKVLFEPWTLALAGVLTVIGSIASPNVAILAACTVTLPAAVWFLGGTNSHRVLLWLIAIAWLQIVADVVSANLKGEVLSDGSLGEYRILGILFSLCAVLILAVGMRVGTGKSGWSVSPIAGGGSVSTQPDKGVMLHRALLGYLASVILSGSLGALAHSMPGLAQPVLALALMKFVFVYLIAARVFRTKQGYAWLLLVSASEIVTGLTGFFSGYKEAFFVMFIALASSRRPASVREWMFGLTAVLVLFWVSLVWTASKKEYRFVVVNYPIEQRIGWFAQRFSGSQIDYDEAFTELFERIGYTKYFSVILAHDAAGSLPTENNYYANALQHVLTPRILFPDKASLDDSAKTTALIDLSIDAETSIGVGYVAEAFVDFGFPGLLGPVFLVGLMTGAAARYFMSQPAPLVVREAFATATLFRSFSFEANIDKNLGGFIISCIVLGFILRVGYPFIASWLEGSDAGRWSAVAADASSEG